MQDLYADRCYPVDDAAQRRESRRMMALDCAIRTRGGNDTPADMVVAACLFVAFLEAGA
jgi:hypothetical protein